MHLLELFFGFGMVLSCVYWRLQTGEWLFALMGTVLFIGFGLVWWFVEPAEAKYASPPDSKAAGLISHLATVAAGFTLFNSLVYKLQGFVAASAVGDRVAHLATYLKFGRLAANQLGWFCIFLGVGVSLGNYLARSPLRGFFQALALIGAIISFWAR